MKHQFIKIMMIDDVILWSKLESTCSVYLILLILFRRRMIFKMLSLEHWTEKWTCWHWGSSVHSDPPPPLGYEPVWGQPAK